MPVAEKTLTPRQAKRRAAILRVVRSQIEASGFAGLNIRNVARGARVSPSTLYEIYGSKEALILAAVADTFRELVIDERRYKPGLERLMRRLESIAQMFEASPRTAEAVTKLFLQGDADSPANDVFLENAIDARRASLQEMLDAKQLKPGTDLNFYSRALVSVTWGTALLWLKGKLPLSAFRQELLRASMCLIVPETTTKIRSRVQDILDRCAQESD